MKRSIAILLVFFAIVSVHAQSVTQALNVEGIKVIFKPTLKNVINVRIYFRGGVTNYNANQAGIENLALDATTKCGNRKYNKNAFKDSTDKYGVLMYGSSTYDYGYIEVNCISKYFNQGWDLFSEAVMNPVFDVDEVNLLKHRKSAAIRVNQSNAEISLLELLRQNAFKNTPYSTNPLGTEETVNGLSADDLKDYYKKILNKNKIFIVVVGNITKQDLFEKILGAFGNMPSEPYSSADLQTPVWKDNNMAVENRKLSTNYVGAIMNSPEFTSVNYVPFRLGISGLSGNIYQYLRTQRNLSYDPGANSLAFKMPYAVMFASTNNVQEVMDGMVSMLKNIQSRGLNDEWLQHIKNSYITRSYINDQSASAITNNLGLAEILGNWQYADDLPELVKMVTVEQVNNALNSYIVGLRWAFLGNTEDIDGFKVPAY
jgi:zinc protease